MQWIIMLNICLHREKSSIRNVYKLSNVKMQTSIQAPYIIPCFGSTRGLMPFQKHFLIEMQNTNSASFNLHHLNSKEKKQGSQLWAQGCHEWGQMDSHQLCPCPSLRRIFVCILFNKGFRGWSTQGNIERQTDKNAAINKYEMQKKKITHYTA